MGPGVKVSVAKF